MNKVKSIFLVFFLGLLISCNSDDSEITKLDQNKINIIGIWAQTSSIIENGNGDSLLNGCDLKLRIEFKTNKVIDIYQYLGGDCKELQFSYEKYSITETELTIRNVSNEIIELSETTLIYIWNNNGNRIIDTFVKQ
jgi:hypothetical protein